MLKTEGGHPVEALVRCQHMRHRGLLLRKGVTDILPQACVHCCGGIGTASWGVEGMVYAISMNGERIYEVMPMYMCYLTQVKW